MCVLWAGKYGTSYSQFKLCENDIILKEFEVYS